ncbi:MAG: hypothetical protein HYS12_04285 [Planctomycetes bacterium]|nr:hypothetical protein [Planctomycetota bacterium]
MSLRRVTDDRAGPDALGILLPPGLRTVLIVRPRGLRWDLLLVQGMAGTSFRSLGRAEAPLVAQAFYRALEAWNSGGAGHVGVVASSEGTGFLVWADVGDFALVACERIPGQPYRPMLFAAEEEARAAVGLIAAALCPPAHAEQEVYLNTRNFTR